MKIPGMQHLTINPQMSLVTVSPREAESLAEGCLRDKNFTCIAACGHGKVHFILLKSFHMILENLWLFFILLDRPDA